MAISIKAPYQAFFNSTEAELKASCIKTGILDRVHLETELVDATIDGNQHYNIPAIIHTDYGCRAKKNEEIASAGAELFERATTIIPFREDAQYRTWAGTDWSTEEFDAVAPKATFVVTIDEEGNDRVLAYIQPQVYFTDDPTWFNHLAPPSLRTFYMAKVWQNNTYDAGSFKYNLIDIHTGEIALIPDSGYTELIAAENLDAVDDIDWYLTNARKTDLGIMDWWVPTNATHYTGKQIPNVSIGINSPQEYFRVSGPCKSLGPEFDPETALGWGVVATGPTTVNGVCQDSEFTGTGRDRTAVPSESWSWEYYVINYAESEYYFPNGFTCRTSQDVEAAYSGDDVNFSEYITITYNFPGGQSYQFTQAHSDSTGGTTHSVLITSFWFEPKGNLLSGTDEDTSCEVMYQVFDTQLEVDSGNYAYHYELFPWSFTESAMPLHLESLKAVLEAQAIVFVTDSANLGGSWPMNMNYQLTELYTVFVPYDIRELGLPLAT